MLSYTAVIGPLETPQVVVDATAEDVAADVENSGVALRAGGVLVVTAEDGTTMHT